MFDIKWIRNNAEAFDAAMLRRKGDFATAADLLNIDDRRRDIIVRLNDAQEKRNAMSKQIGQAKAQKDEAKASELMAEVARLKDIIPVAEADERLVEQELHVALSVLPNLVFDDVPQGNDESDNVEYFGRNGTEETVANVRASKPEFSFAPKEHFEIGEANDGMDFEVATKISGSRFVVLKGQIARLERALGQFMLDLHTTEHGYTEVQPPLLVRDEALFGTNQLPKFEEDLFFAGHGDGRLALIPTAEVPLTNLVRESILSEEELPLRFSALTPCFRSEAGSAGRDTRGMLRQHQFNKVEMVSITLPNASFDEHERMLGCAEAVLKKLGLHYRVMDLCTGDIGFGAKRTYDLEVWLPGQDTYREISSVSICGDFQARRMNTQYRPGGGEKLKGGLPFVHTLNGSGTAVGRCLIAVLENYQQEDGSVLIPDVLKSYMGGLTSIGGRS
ncbi:serine--tRNA ligase [Devosia rhodophyticola]|uniref:Serine--tRNA ligase n=1 Tax=Devosia rhodophyticola TaxID=3026423 RepID=A0ABY7YWP3_9HYPH|nr:serine--tRNA ligase [Devosia rhodophyticola]WDR05759.1 serine--tRNA ligase [Devosia rhodophyticola]